MATYYMWVNFDKRQYLESDVFDCGLKLRTLCWVGVDMTDAACTLLAREWNGDLVALVGDEDYLGLPALDGEPTPPPWQLLCERAGFLPYEYAEDHYDDVTGMFRIAEGKTGWGWEDESERPNGQYIQKPYADPFDREIVHHRYVVNETRRVFYDRGEDPASGAFDPLPILMSTGEGDLEIGGRWEPGCDGLWIGDKVTPSHRPPGDSSYEDVTGLYAPG